MERYSPRLSNAAKKALAETAILTALRSAQDRGLTTFEIREKTHVAEQTVNARIKDLRERGSIHIGSWRVRVHQLAPAYVAGPGKDAARDEYVDALGDDAENDLQDEMSKRHRRWARTWKPNRPIEASWIS